MLKLSVASKGKVLEVQVARGHTKIKISVGDSCILITPNEAAALANFLGDACESMNVLTPDNDSEIQDDKL